MADETKEEYLTIDELCGLLKVTKSWVYSHTYSGKAKMPCLRLGRHLRFNKNEVIKYFDDKHAVKTGGMAK